MSARDEGFRQEASRSLGLHSSGESARSSPIIIKQPITFSGNRLVHLPPETILVQRNEPDDGIRMMSPSQRIPSGFLGAALSNSPLCSTSPKVTLAGEERQQLGRSVAYFVSAAVFDKMLPSLVRRMANEFA